MTFLRADNLLPSGLNSEDKTRVMDAVSDLQLAISPTLTGEWADAFAALKWPQHTALVCDNDTWSAAAEQIAQELQQAGYAVLLVNLGTQPTATEQLVQYVRESAAECEAFIAVGSGTINDVTQMAAYHLKKAYAVCGTAPSMNGYISTNAAIMTHGHKQSLPARLPVAALFDLSVLRAAPARLRAAGVGDSICRSTAQIDWRLSHLLMGTSYDPLSFSLLAPYEKAMLNGSMEALIRTLLLSGLGMTLAGGSYPASQGEHLIAHAMEMLYPEIAHKTLHGEHIAVTTLYMAEHQQRLLARKTPPQWQKPHDILHSLAPLGIRAGATVCKAYEEKCNAAEAAETNRVLEQNWEDIRTDLSQYSIALTKLKHQLISFDAPRHIKMLGWKPEQFSQAIQIAPFIRNRFTFLDVS